MPKTADELEVVLKELLDTATNSPARFNLKLMDNMTDVLMVFVHNPQRFTRLKAELEAGGMSGRKITEFEKTVKDGAAPLLDGLAERRRQEAAQRSVANLGLPPGVNPQEPPTGATWAAHLVRLSLDEIGGMELWRDEEGDPWITTWEGASFRVGDQEHINHMVSVWDAQHYHYRAGDGQWTPDPVLIGREDLNKAVASITARAVTAPQYTAHLRVAPLDEERPVGGGFMLDLGYGVRKLYGTLDYDCILVEETDWELSWAKRRNIKFRRGVGAQSLPIPVKPCDKYEAEEWLGEYQDWLAMTDDEFRAWMTWITYTIQPQQTYPIMVLNGPQGSFKSTKTRSARRFIDPSVAEMDDTPSDARNFAITCDHSYLVCIDNASGTHNSGLSPEIQDVMAKTATGAGYRHRKLHTSRDLTVFSYCRPIIINGIGESVTRPDCLERSYVFRLGRPEGGYRTEGDLWAEFNERKMYWLGAILDVVVYGLGHIKEVKSVGDLRMAGFAEWGCAVAPALGWTPESWLDNYRGNQARGTELVIEGSKFATLLVKVAAGIQDLNKAGNREGKYQPEDFLSRLRTFASIPLDQGGGGWSETDLVFLPQTTKTLHDSIQRIQPALEGVGIRINLDARMGPKANRVRCIQITDSRNLSVTEVEDDGVEPEDDSDDDKMMWS